MTEPLAPTPLTYAGRPVVSITDVRPSFIALSIRSNCSYASGMSTSSSVACEAAIVSGLPLNVPAMS